MSLKNKKKIRIIIGSLNTGGTEKQLLKIINFAKLPILINSKRVLKTTFWNKSKKSL